MWRLIRPDAITVWNNPIVRERLSWYYRVMNDEMPAKFIICKKIYADDDIKSLDMDSLWDLHSKLSEEFDRIFRDVSNERMDIEELDDQNPNFLDLKVEIAYRIYRNCEFCERRCRIDRNEKVGICRVKRTNVHSFFHHYGEESPLVPSGTIFYGGCNLKCVYCIDEDDYMLVRYSKDNIVSVEKVKDVVERIKQGEQVELLTLRGWRKITNIIEKLSDEIYEIITNRGKRIRLTSEHLIIVKDDKKLIEKAVKDLCEGDTLVTLPFNEIKYIENNITYINLIEEIEKRAPPSVKSSIRVKNVANLLKELRHKYKVKYRDLFRKIRDFKYSWIYADSIPFDVFIQLYKNYNEFKNHISRFKLSMRKGAKYYLPALFKISPEFMRLLGYFVSEGNYLREYGIVFTASNDDVQKDIVNCLNKVFGSSKNAKIIIYNYEGRAPQIIMPSKLAYILFRYILGMGRRASNKSFPWIIFNVSKKLLREFLSAYLTGDGTLNIGKKRNISIRFITTSEKIAYQLSYIFGLNNIQYRIKERNPSPKYKLPTDHVSKNKQYWVEVNGYNDILKLLDIANFIDKNRNSKLMKILKTFRKVKNEIKGDRVKRKNAIKKHGRVYDIVLNGNNDLEEHVFFAGNGILIHNCQNHDISQEYPNDGAVVDAKKLMLIQKELRKSGARNINHVGGDPTPNLHVILESLRYLDINVPQLWNSNMYCSMETMRLLREVIDIWLPDLKYGNDECAKRLSLVENYWEVATRNIKFAHDSSDIIIRHLVLPNHIECCTKPVLRWIARNCPRALVNIMEQYRPRFLVERNPSKWPDISRSPSMKEMEEAYSFAKRLGIVYEPVS